MRRFAVALLVASASCAISTQNIGEVVLETDEYQGTQTKSVMTILSNAPRVELMLTYLESPEIEAERQRLLDTASEGVDTSILEREPTHRLRVSRMGSDWHWMDCHHVNLLIDGEPHDPEEDHDGSVISGYGGTGVVEHVYFDLPESLVKSLALADESKLRVCADEFVLSGENKTHIGRYYTTALEASP